MAYEATADLKKALEEMRYSKKACQEIVKWYE